MSKVCVASCGPLANSSSARGARSMRCRVRLATRYDGRSLMTLKLTLFGVKLSGCAMRPDRRAAAGSSAGNRPRCRSMLTASMRPAHCVRSVGGMLQLVEQIAGGAFACGRETGGLAGGVQLLVTRLRPENAGQGADRRDHRHQLDLDLALLLPVDERRGDLLEADVVQSDLVVLVVGVSGPIADGGDGAGSRTELALAGDLRLLQPDVGLGRRRLDAGDVIVAGEARDRDAGIAAVEQV